MELTYAMESQEHWLREIANDAEQELWDVGANVTPEEAAKRWPANFPALSEATRERILDYVRRAGRYEGWSRRMRRRLALRIAAEVTERFDLTPVAQLALDIYRRVVQARGIDPAEVDLANCVPFMHDDGPFLWITRRRGCGGEMRFELRFDGDVPTIRNGQLAADIK